MYRCTKCNNESKKEHIKCPRPSCNGVGTYVEFEPGPKTYSLKRTPIQSKQATVVKDDELQQWFQDRRKEMVGICSCGCGGKTSKDDDKFFKASICHILPKSKFKSVRTHKDNWVELSFWQGCHANMDNRSSELWTKLACWSEIQRKFEILKPLIADNEIKHLPLIFK